MNANAPAQLLDVPWCVRATLENENSSMKYARPINHSNYYEIRSSTLCIQFEIGLRARYWCRLTFNWLTITNKRWICLNYPTTYIIFNIFAHTHTHYLNTQLWQWEFVHVQSCQMVPICVRRLTSFVCAHAKYVCQRNEVWRLTRFTLVHIVRSKHLNRAGHPLSQLGIHIQSHVSTNTSQ